MSAHDVIVYKWHRKGSKKCPISRCDYHYVSSDGLLAHLTNYHRKHELAMLIVDDLLLFKRCVKKGSQH